MSLSLLALQKRWKGLMDKFHIFENVLSEEQCQKYSDFFWTNSVDDVSNPRPHFKFYGTETSGFSTAVSWDPSKHFERIVSFAKDYFLSNYPVEHSFDLKRMFVHIMKTGAEINHHIDDGDIYLNKPAFEKHYSAVLMINDEYDGGEFYFKNLDFCQKLKAGSLILFRGDEEREHGVLPITDGYRISMPIFFREYK